MSSEIATEPTQFPLWCEGCPQVGARPLNAEEVGLLRQASGRALVRYAWAFLAFPAFPFAAALVLGSASAGHPSPLVGILALLATFGGLSLGFLLARDGARIRRALKADLRRGEAARFAREGYELEAAPLSRLVLTRHGRPVRPLQPTKLWRAAPLPEGQMAVRISTTLLSDSAPRDLEKRHLSELEKVELGLHQSRLRKVRLHGLLAAAAFVMAAGAAVAQGSGSSMMSVVLWALVLSRWMAQGFGAVRALKMLEADRSEGWVVRVPGTVARPQAEYLPISNLPFTADGLPADWRRVPER